MWTERSGSLGTDEASQKFSNTLGWAALLKMLHTFSGLIALSINRNWCVPEILKGVLSTAVKVIPFNRAQSDLNLFEKF